MPWFRAGCNFLPQIDRRLGFYAFIESTAGNQWPVLSASLSFSMLSSISVGAMGVNIWGYKVRGWLSF